MNSELLTLGSEHYDEWNRFVDLSPQGDVFCYSWWLDAVTKSRFRIIAVIENDEIVAGMPLPYDKYGKINEPFLTRTLGILYKPQENISDHKKISNLRKWAELLVEKIPIDDFVQTSTHYNFVDWLPYRWKGLKQTTRYTYIIDYSNNDKDALWQNLNRGRKNLINRAYRNGISVQESEDIALLHHLVSMSYKRQGLNLRFTFGELEHLDQKIRNNGKRLILMARDIKGPVAAIYLAYTKKSSYYLISGSYPALRCDGGHTLVLWEAVKYFKDKVDFFNFGGSDIKQIEEHIKGFGGILTPYFHIYNERQLRYLDVRYHLKSIYDHSLDIINAFRIRYFTN